MIAEVTSWAHAFTVVGVAFAVAFAIWAIAKHQ